MRLGCNQIGVLEALVKHGGEWRNDPVRCPWLWDTPSNTDRICMSLHWRGLVSLHGRDRGCGIWRITEAGRALISERQPVTA